MAKFQKQKAKEITPKVDDRAAKIGLVKDKEAEMTYKTITSETRNVIVIGRTRVGKSTLINVLSSLQTFAKLGSVYSETEDPKLTTYMMLDQKDAKKGFTLNVIDTPGFREFKTEKARNDESIRKLITALLKAEITKLHTVFVCLEASASVTEDDIKLIEEIYELFGEKITIEVCFTKSEQMDDTQRELRFEEVKKHPKLAEIFQRSEVGPFYTGALDLDKVHLSDVKNVLERIFTDRENIINFMLFNEKSINVKQLNFIKQEAKKVHTYAKETLSSLKLYSTLKDSDATLVKNLFADMEFKKDNYVYLQDDQITDWALMVAAKRLLNAKIYREKWHKPVKPYWEFIHGDSSWDPQVHILEETFNSK